MSETIHNRIAMLRVERRMSRRELAEALGIHYQTVGYLERGEFSPSLHLALRIAEFFGVPVEAVFSTTPFARIGSTGDDLGGRVPQASHSPLPAKPRVAISRRARPHPHGSG